MGEAGARVGRVCLTDFGLARHVTTGSRYTQTGETLGTPAYMSPEQARGELTVLGPASDAWALGCVLFELVTGRPPFEGDATAVLVGNILLREPPRLTALSGAAPPDLDRVVGACLRKPVGARYPGARAVADDLERLLRGERPLARPGRPARRRRAAVVAVAAAGLAAAAWLGGPWRGDGTTAPTAAALEDAGERLAAQARVARLTDPGRAAALLAEAVAASPHRHDWRVERGLLLWSAGRGREARAEWSAVPADAPFHARARLYRALEAFFGWEGDSLRGAEAQPDLEWVAATAGLEGALATAVLACRAADWAGARTRLRELTGWEAALLAGYVEGNDPDGDQAEAVRRYSEALRDGIAFAWVHANRGHARIRLHDFAEAEADLDAALRLDPTLQRAWNNRALARNSLKRYDAAIADATEALRLDPDDAFAWNNRGYARDALGDHAGAVADYTQALARQPAFGKALSNRALARRALGDVAGAIEDWDAGLAVAPDDPPALYSRGNAHALLGHLAEAVRDYDAAIAQRPEYAEAFHNRALARHRLGDLAGADADYTEAIRLRPGYARAYMNRGTVRNARGDHAGAIADATDALRFQPDYPEALNNRGIARGEAGDAGGAVADYRAAIAQRADYGAPHLNLALALREQGAWGPAAAEFAEYLRLEPRAADAETIRALLAECTARAPAGAR
jgi:tetratricopeptide (TPR) repeat protein